MTGKFWHFETDVYGLRIGLYLGPLSECTPERLTRWLRKAWPDLPSDGHVELPPADGTVYADSLRIEAEDGTVYRIVRIPRFRRTSPADEAFDVATLAHESLHVAATALRDVGVPFDGNAEAHAYLTELVFRRFLEILYDKGEGQCTAKKDHGSSGRRSAPGTSEGKRSANGAACRRDDAAARTEDTRTGR